MKTFSFRRRMALVSGLVTGVTLLVLGLMVDRALAWHAQSQLETRLSALGYEWSTLPPTLFEEDSFSTVGVSLGLAGEQSLAVVLVGFDGVLVGEIGDWPEVVPLDLMPVEPLYEGRGLQQRRREGNRGEIGGFGPGASGPEMSRGGPPIHVAPVDSVELSWVQGEDERYCVMRFRTMWGEGNVCVTLSSVMAQLSPLRLAIWGMVTIATLLMMVASWWLSGRALRPLRTLSESLGGVTARGLDQRMELDLYAQEVRPIVQQVNDMLGRLEKSFQQASRFSADAAHELQTPMTVIQFELERASDSQLDQQGAVQVLERVGEECARVRTIVNSLLILSKTDAERLPVNTQLLALAELVEDVEEDVSLWDSTLTVTVDVDRSLMCWVDPDWTQRIVQNLISNAVKHNRPAGEVRVVGQAIEDGVELWVCNTCVPGAPTFGDEVFERFTRGDPARGRRVDGLGLGLALARELAHAQGGRIRLKHPEETDWVGFALWLPGRGLESIEAPNA